ncbi:hypothetical protein [Silanimonas sp.]|jgi:hypothetical protein|uniref:hypothetical protein n=1 Tax=Silanimonas sp. TaxID=1929290 RepID=UPI0022BB8ABB|nr:hypothetical protein [Silanimonas sp.]MCZ8115912.1 hypothetical protein [Silanimonas sp.]
MNTPDDGRLPQARALFDAQVEALDGATATALRARRREAITTMPTRSRRAWWWPASGVATAALAVVLWLPRTDGPAPALPAGSDGMAASTPATVPQADPGAPMALDAGAAEAARFADTALAELEDDAEFYAWIATVPDDAASPNDPLDLPAAGPHEGLTL